MAVAAGAGGGSGDGPGTTSTAAARQTDPAASEHSHDSNIYVMNLETRRLRKVTDGQIAQQPSWAPNRRIAFSAADCDDSCWSQLFYVDPRGQNQVLIQANQKRHLFHPTWSSDGRIAAVALGQGLFTLSPGHPRPRTLTTGQSDEAPAWAPHTDWIAFDKRVGGTNYDIFTVNAKTRKIRRLTRDPRQQTNPSWSPDGSKLAFSEQERSGRWAVITMHANGGGRKRITGNGVSAQEPRWSPDGKRIVFVDQQLDTARIAVIDVDGKHLRKLTQKSLFVSTPAWSPDGRSIAFSGLPTIKAPS